MKAALLLSLLLSWLVSTGAATPQVYSTASGVIVTPSSAKDYWVDFGVYDVPNRYLDRTDPGTQISFSGRLRLLKRGFYTPKKLTLVSLTGASVEPGVNVYYYSAPDQTTKADPIDSLPYSYHEFTSYTGETVISEGFLLKVRVGGLDSKGKGVPVRLRVRFEGEFRTEPGGQPSLVDRTFDLVTLVSDAPAIRVDPRFVSVNRGELRPDGTAQVTYRVTAAGASMKNLSLRAQAPTGTNFAGYVSPAATASSDKELLWRVPGPVTTFEATFDVRVKKRPGPTCVARYTAVADVVDQFTRTAAGQFKMPVKNYTRGRIDYYTSFGINGPVEVGKPYPFSASGWDPEGGNILVTLDDQAVTTVPFANPTGMFTVTPFREPDLTEVLSAQQKGKPSDTEVTGGAAATVELLSGVATITDGSTIFRRLRAGSPIAAGEIDFPRIAPTGSGSNTFGLFQISNPDGAALVRKTGDTRLLYARSGAVSIAGSIIVGRLRVSTGKKFLTASFRNSGFDYTQYDPAGKVNLLEFQTDTLQPSTPGGTVQFNGFCRRAGDLTVKGSAKLNGSLLYVDGDLTIQGDLDCEGTILCTGNFTQTGSVRMVPQNELVLYVGGTFANTP